MPGAGHLTSHLEGARRAFADKVERLAQLENPGLTRGFASVPRERFVGPGPWQILKLPAEHGYLETPDDDPVHLYDNVLVALDAPRKLNNGEPVTLAQWLDLLELRPGTSFAHIGCGVGYYTAIAGEALRPGGRCLALEVEPDLASRAARNLAPWPDIEVREASALEASDGPFDAIFVNAGATQVLDSWLDALADGGRLLVPLTVAIAGEIGAGRVVRIVRRGSAFEAVFVSFAAIFHCTGARSEPGEGELRRAYADGDADSVRSLRRSAHDRSDSCWLHTDGACLSYREETP